MNLTQFKDWSLKEVSVAKYNDGEFKGECVSLVNQYCWRVLNIPADAWGDARDWATNPNVAQYLDKVKDIQAGNILVYGANYGGGAGHIEISLGGNQSLFQNRNNNRKVGTGQSIANPIAILRAKSQGDKEEMNLTSFQSLFLRYCNRYPRQDEIDNQFNKVSIDDLLLYLQNIPEGRETDRAQETGYKYLAGELTAQPAPIELEPGLYKVK